MQKPEYLEQIAYELARDVQAEGVRYIEVRFAPQLHINKQMDLKTVLESVNRGLERAQKEFNQQTGIKDSSEPPFFYGIIVCAMRFLGPWSDYYKGFIDTFPYSDIDDICRMAALELAKGTIRMRDDYGIPIEVCLTSNMQTNPSIFDVSDHTFGKMIQNNLSVTLCTDNRTVSKTDLTQEIMLAVNHFPLSSKTLKNCIGYGFKRSFFPGAYSEKRKYVRQCLDYYEKITEGVEGLSLS